MSNTIRKEPSNSGLLKTPKHIQLKRFEEMALDALEELPSDVVRHGNRMKAANSRVPDNWDDIIISEFRGQKYYIKMRDKIYDTSSRSFYFW